ncbi:proline dehydrogenase family protein [Oleidesulfovibrio sp.]|uniref:proline dehydrogenase family protein n=1 Tax=Oleidesulfovibrio sp. TaxID=2909707 RepID=UPI003A8C6A97
MRLWQKSMIALARSKRVTATMQQSAVMQPFASRFVGGGTVAQAMKTASALQSEDVCASLFYLGEYESDLRKITAAVNELEDCIDALAASGHQVHVSVDPTQIGSMLSWQLCAEHTEQLAQRIAGTQTEQTSRRTIPSPLPRKVLMLDMEDSGVTQQTLDLYQNLNRRNLPVAITIQTYLHRSAADLKELVRQGAMVRLVKGAFAENASLAFTGRGQMDNAYRKGIDMLFSAEALECGVYPVLGTHDHRMVAYAAEKARKNGWPDEGWEVEMLYGVRPDYCRQLVAGRRIVRLYLPYGKDWWSYSVRRLGEAPRNLLFALRAIFSGSAVKKLRATGGRYAG